VRIAITGVSGFVGGAIAGHLAHLGHQVIGVSRTGSVAADLTALDFADQVAAATPPCEAIVHCGASLEKDYLSQSMLLCNAVGTQSVLRLASLWKCKMLFYMSSVPVIGIPRIVPIDEEHPTAPTTGYHTAKLLGEQLVTLAGSATLRTLSYRLSAPIGPRMPQNRILFTFVRQALRNEAIRIAGQGTRTQNYVDVRDIARAVELGLNTPADGVFNIAGDRSISNLDLANLCIKLTGSHSTISFSGGTDPEEGLRWEISTARARKALGYEPAYSLEDSIPAVAHDL
jgi:nucleoside-diphosphate-sugar epimerase